MSALESELTSERGKYSSIVSDRKQSELRFKDEFERCNQLISEENKSEASIVNSEANFTLQQTQLAQFQTRLKQCGQLLRQYS